MGSRTADKCHGRTFDTGATCLSNITERRRETNEPNLQGTCFSGVIPPLKQVKVTVTEGGTSPYTALRLVRWFRCHHDVCFSPVEWKEDVTWFLNGIVYSLYLFSSSFPPPIFRVFGFFFCTDMIKKTGAGAECPEPRHSTLTAVCRSAFKHQIRNSRQRSVMENLDRGEGWMGSGLFTLSPPRS